MRFEDIPGNEIVKQALVRMANAGRIPHAVMFHESEGCGALALAVAFLQYANCKNRGASDSCGICIPCNQISKLIYPDLYFVFPTAGDKVTSLNYMTQWRELFIRNPFFTENGLYEALGIEKKSCSIAVAEAKNIISELSVSSYSAGSRCVIIWLPEKMQTEAANRLLKIIEEPSDNTLFLFVTHDPEKVLKTIRSRCQIIRVLPATKDQVAKALPRWTGVDSEQAIYAANFCAGSIGVAIRSLAEKDENVVMTDTFMALMDAVIARDLLTALDVGDTLSALDSREKQKAFCKFASDSVRKIFMLQKGLPGISGIRPEDMDFYKETARKCGPDFCTRALKIISRANSMIASNVNQKIIFTNMVSRLFVS